MTLMLRPLIGRTVLVDYWTREGALPPPGVSLGGMVSWLAGRWRALSANPLGLPLGLPLGALAGALAIGGAVLVWRRGPAAALVVALAPLMVLAGMAGSFPLDGRLALDLVPIAALSLAALVVAATSPPASWPKTGRRALAVAAAGGLVAILASAALRTLPQVAAVRLVEEMRPVLARVHREMRPGDRVLVARATYSTAAYYAGRERVGLSGLFWLHPTPPGRRCNDRAVVARAGLARPGARMWIVLGHRSPSPVDAPWTVMLSHFDIAGEVIARVRAPGAAAYLITPREAADPEAAPPPAGDRRCLRILALGERPSLAASAHLQPGAGALVWVKGVVGQVGFRRARLPWSGTSLLAMGSAPGEAGRRELPKRSGPGWPLQCLPAPTPSGRPRCVLPKLKPCARTNR